MYYVWIAKHEVRHVGVTLYEVVVVSINACYHILAYALFHQCQQSLFLAFVKVVACGQHDLKVAFLIFKLRQHHTPEQYIVVALDIGHDAPACRLATHDVGSVDIVGGDVFV